MTTAGDVGVATHARAGASASNDFIIRRRLQGAKARKNEKKSQRRSRSSCRDMRQSEMRDLVVLVIHLRVQGNFLIMRKTRRPHSRAGAGWHGAFLAPRNTGNKEDEWPSNGALMMPSTRPSSGRALLCLTPNAALGCAHRACEARAYRPPDMLTYGINHPLLMRRPVAGLGSGTGAAAHFLLDPSLEIIWPSLHNKFAWALNWRGRAVSGGRSA